MFILAYLLVIASSQYYGNKYLNELQAFDTNGDGSFSADEQTDGYDEAERRFVHDTGRTFAPILGFIISGILALILGLFLKLQSAYIRRIKRGHGGT